MENKNKTVAWLITILIIATVAAYSSLELVEKQNEVAKLTQEVNELYIEIALLNENVTLQQENYDRLFIDVEYIREFNDDLIAEGQFKDDYIDFYEQLDVMNNVYSSMVLQYGRWMNYDEIYTEYYFDSLQLARESHDDFIASIDKLLEYEDFPANLPEYYNSRDDLEETKLHFEDGLYTFEQMGVEIIEVQNGN